MDTRQGLYNMNILFDNVNLASSSGPNNFAKKLSSQISELDDNFILTSIQEEYIDVQLSFIQTNYKMAPTALRLDGIYFNSEQGWEELNEPIKKSYINSEAIIYQSNFNKLLTEHYFGSHPNTHVIHNGTRMDWISNIPRLDSDKLNQFAGTWCCASSWRPHKRLKDNVAYFLEHAPKDRCLVIAGPNPDYNINDPRVFYVGSLDWTTLIALYKRSETFLHLAYLDHCPNVVVDARASGCNVVCSSAGGTHEVSGENAKIIIENEWDLSPTKLYEPPPMDFSSYKINDINSDLDMISVSRKYLKVLEGIAGGDF